jgi:hypothetical protein
MTCVNNLIEQLRLLKEARFTLKAEHDREALKLVLNPDNIDVLEAVEGLASKLEATDKRIALFESALDGAAAVDKENAEIARLNAAAEARDKAVSLAADRTALAAEVDKTIATLGEQMAALEKLGIAMGDAATDVVRNTMTGDSGRYLNEIEQARGSTAIPFSVAFTAALRRAGVERLLGAELGHVMAEFKDSTVASFAGLSEARVPQTLDAILRRGGSK